MWNIKVEFGILVAFAVGTLVIYNRVFAICYTLKAKVHKDPGAYLNAFRRTQVSQNSQWDSMENDHGGQLAVASREIISLKAEPQLDLVEDGTELHFSMAAASIYKTIPETYPQNGTGTTVKIAYRFNASVFNSFCTNEPNLYAVVAVYSRPASFLKRSALRGTLGHACKLYRCKIFFIVGISTDEVINDRLKEEYDTEKDILAMPKIDTYRDLNNKAVAMLNWILKYCKTPRYVIRAIDDVHINLQSLFSQLDAIESKRYIFGYLSTGRKALRNKNSKWYISKLEWPFVDYPDYATGTVFAFRNGISKELRKTVLKAPYCWIEDVWFTGIVRLKSGIPFIESTLQPYVGPPGKLNPQNINDYLYVHELKVKELYSLFIASKMYAYNVTRTKV